jgi:hypothetical protein
MKALETQYDSIYIKCKVFSIANIYFWALKYPINIIFHFEHIIPEC